MVRARIVQPDVWGEWCSWSHPIADLATPPWRRTLQNHALATEMALRSVPEANVLLDARLEIRTTEYVLAHESCVKVYGDAARVD